MNIYSLEHTLGPAIWVVTGILIFLIFEYLIPFRTAVLSKLNRWRINFTVNLTNVVIIDLCFISLLKKTSIFSGNYQFDLFNKFQLSSLWRIVITIIVLDLITYFWHRLNHTIPFLWRFHRVHHTDLEIDVSSASRFHFGEVTGTTFITYSLMLFLGATIFEVRIFQVILFLMAQLGHSNVRLWSSLEGFLMLFLVPPSMHRIHHSEVKEETDSNYGTIFSIWDRLFGTFRKKLEQEEIVFGLKEFKNPNELTVRKLLALPFRGLFQKRNVKS